MPVVPAHPLGHMRWPELPYPQLTPYQREYVLGAVLGDDSLVLPSHGIHARLRTQQSLAHKDYLMWKYEIMKNHTLRPPRIVQNNRYGRIHWGVRFHTRVTPSLTEFYHLCYPRGKKNRVDSLAQTADGIFVSRVVYGRRELRLGTMPSFLYVIYRCVSALAATVDGGLFQKPLENNRIFNPA